MRVSLLEYPQFSAEIILLCTHRMQKSVISFDALKMLPKDKKDYYLEIVAKRPKTPDALNLIQYTFLVEGLIDQKYIDFFADEGAYIYAGNGYFVLQANLKTIAEITKKRFYCGRLSTGCVLALIEAILECIFEVHPWARDFILFDDLSRIENYIKSHCDDFKKREMLLNFCAKMRRKLSKGGEYNG